MNPDVILAMVQADLNLFNPPPATITFLENLIAVSQIEIEREGITLNLESVDHQQTIAMYASYLYRRRSAADNGMPRMLRYRLNNLLFSQKMGASQNEN